MSRRKKDPLRDLTDAGAAGTDPAQPLPGRPGRRGHPGQILAVAAATTTRTAAGRPPLRRRRLPPRRPLQRRGPRRPDAPPRRRAAADLRPGGDRAGSPPRPARAPTPEADGTATWSLSTLRRTLRAAPDGLPRGLDLHHPPRPPRVRGQLPAHPHLVPDRHGPAAPQGRAGGRRRPGRRARKKVDRGRLPARRGDGAGGLVHRPGRALPDDPLPGPVLAARGRPGAAAARVPPRRHGQGPDAVPTRPTATSASRA